MHLQIIVSGNKNGNHKTLIRNDKSNQYHIFDYTDGKGITYLQVIDFLKYLNISYSISFS